MRPPHAHDHDSYRRGWNIDRPAGPSGRADDAASMRASTTERTEVTNALCRHFGDGRLDEAELEDRLARAAAAKTRAELAPLLHDLPRLDASGPELRPRRPRRHLGWILVAFVALLSFGWSVTGIAAGLFHLPFHVPWLLVAVVAFVLLRRGGHRHHRH